MKLKVLYLTLVLGLIIPSSVQQHSALSFTQVSNQANIYRKLLVSVGLPLVNEFSTVENNFQWGVTLYADCNYRGSNKTLSPGFYYSYDLGIGDKQLSSIRIPSGFVITLYQVDGANSGLNVQYGSDIDCLGPKWNDKTSSVLVSRNQNSGQPNYSNNNSSNNNSNNNNNYYNNNNYGAVTIYENCDYGGNSRQLDEGYYDTWTLGIRNDALSSLKVARGYAITLYWDSKFKGRSITMRGNVNCIVGDWNDQTSSVYVSKADYAPGNTEQYNSGYNGYHDYNNNRHDNNHNYNDYYNRGGQPVIYEECGFRGKSKTLSVGKFETRDLGISNDALSSIRVPNGWQVTLYEAGGFRDKMNTFYSDDECLQDYWNDKTSSIIVTRTGL